MACIPLALRLFSLFSVPEDRWARKQEGGWVVIKGGGRGPGDLGGPLYFSSFFFESGSVPLPCDLEFYFLVREYGWVWGGG